MPNDYDENGNVIKPDIRLTSEEFARAAQAMRDAGIAWNAAHRATEDAKTALARCQAEEASRRLDYDRLLAALESGI